MTLQVLLISFRYFGNESMAVAFASEDPGFFFSDATCPALCVFPQCQNGQRPSLLELSSLERARNTGCDLPIF